MGVAYHLWQFARINPAAYAFGILFVGQGVAFFLTGVIGAGLWFRYRPRLRPVLGLAFVAYATILYSTLGHLSGHGYSKAPLFGVAPCPTTIFTLGLLMLAERPVPLTLLVVPICWSFIGGSAAVLLAVPEDIGLLLAGLVCGTLLLRQHQRRGGEPAG